MCCLFHIFYLELELSYTEVLASVSVATSVSWCWRFLFISLNSTRQQFVCFIGLFISFLVFFYLQ